MLVPDHVVDKNLVLIGSISDVWISMNEGEVRACLSVVIQMKISNLIVLVLRCWAESSVNAQRHYFSSHDTSSRDYYSRLTDHAINLNRHSWNGFQFAAN